MVCLLAALVTAAPQGHGDSIVSICDVLTRCVDEPYETTLLAEVLKLAAFPED